MKNFFRLIIALIPMVFVTPANALTLIASQWQIRYSVGMPTQPAQDGSGWTIVFPPGTGCANRNCNHVDYITIPWFFPLVDRGVVVQVKIGGPPATFGYSTEAQNVCNSPAAIRVMIEKPGDQSLTDSNGRFWSQVPIYLQPGTQTVYIPYDPSRWTNVDGQVNGPAFLSLLQHPGAIGVTFGGGCFYGHGVYTAPGQYVTLTMNIFAP